MIWNGKDKVEVSIALLTIGADGAFARGRGGHYFSAGKPGGIAPTSGSRLADMLLPRASQPIHFERNEAQGIYETVH
jgi:hypothetical protein